MATSKQLHILATRPAAYARFMQTGQLPRGVKPQSPLIDLLRSLTPHERLAIRGLKVNESLGYQGSRQFHNAEMALKWLAPSTEVFDSFPAESWRIKAFHKKLTLADLKANCAVMPDSVMARHPNL